MTSIVVRVASAVAGAVFVVCAAAQVQAQSLTWHFQSEHENVVDLEFYSQDRDHVWPGNNQVYLLNDYETKQIDLACQPGETICYGAWVRNRPDLYWGVGQDDSQSCESCCYVCDGGESDVMVLNP